MPILPTPSLHQLSTRSLHLPFDPNGTHGWLLLLHQPPLPLLDRNSKRRVQSQPSSSRYGFFITLSYLTIKGAKCCKIECSTLFFTTVAFRSCAFPGFHISYFPFHFLLLFSCLCSWCLVKGDPWPSNTLPSLVEWAFSLG